MHSVFRTILGAAAATLLTVPSHAANAQARPLAADIIAKYVSAIGGKAEIMKVTSIAQIGTLELPSIGLSAEMQMFSAAPNKVASKTEIPGIGTMLNGYNGTVGWDVNPMAGPRLLADKELTTMMEGADFYANLLQSPDRYSELETVGDTTINGEKAWTVKMVRKTSGTKSTSYFSASSGLLLGGVSTLESQMGTNTMTQVISGYQKFGALLMPTKIEQSLGPQQMVLTIKNVQFNSTPESAFDVPAAAKALIKP